MILWCLLLVTLSSAVVAVFTDDFRRAVLAFWLAGLAMGGVYLSIGAELVAIVQCVVSTLAAVSMTVYAIMFGEYCRVDFRTRTQKGVAFVYSMGIGVAFVVLVGLCGKKLELNVSVSNLILREAPGLVSCGELILKEYFLAFEILVVTMFVALIGSGGVGREEQDK